MRPEETAGGVAGPRPAPRAARVLRAVFNGLAAVGTLWIVFLMALIVADVVGRNFLDAPITGVAEIAARSVVAIVFLQLPAAVLGGTLIRADFLTRMLESRTPRALERARVVFALTGAAVFAAIAWTTWPDAVAAWRTNEFFGVQGVFTLPTLPFRAIVTGGGAATAAAFLIVAAIGPLPATGVEEPVH